MTSSASKVGQERTQYKVWEDVPVTFTEFGALDSEEKPRGGFFSRLWKRDKDKDKDGDRQAANPPTAREEDGERGSASPDTQSIAIVQDSPTPGSVISSAHGSKASLADLDQSHDLSQDSSEDQRPGSAPPHRTLSSVLHRLSSILDQRSTAVEEEEEEKKKEEKNTSKEEEQPQQEDQKTPQAYKDSDFKQYWMPDHSCRECYDCGEKFTTFRRRHHCRICGQIFCSKCCNQELPGKIIGYKGGIRVCIYCCRVVQRYAQHTVTTGDERALEDLRAMSQMSESGSFDFGSQSMSPHPTVGDEVSPSVRGDSLPELPGLMTPDLSMPFDLTPQSEFSTEESLLQESKALTQDSVQLRELWRQIYDTEMGVETQTLRIRLRTYHNCIVGKELVDWLLHRDKAAKRVQAIGIGQALLYAGYLECVGNQPPIFKDDFTLYRPGENAEKLDLQKDVEPSPTITEELEKNEPLWLQEIEKEEEDDNSVFDYQSMTMMESEAMKSNSSESDTSRTLYYLSETSHSGSFSDLPKFQVLSREVIEEPLPQQDSSVHGLGDEFLRGALLMGKSCMPSSDVVTCPHGWRLVEQLREENGEKIAYERLKKAHSEHWHVLTRQLLSQNGLLPSWEPVISSCISQITHYVRPDVRLEGDDMDIRSYVHIKKIPGGLKNDTNLVHGVIFTKNIAHKKMKTKIANPLILLLRGTIEFQRVEQKFSSLEPQILQEKEFLRNCIMKMIAYHPNVVVVEKSVSRLAQQFLLQAGITLLYNVKLSVMERLARFTQADIVSSIDGLVGKPNMGFCHDFRCQTYTLPNKETKTLAVFDGCATHLGCTVTLTGGSVSELRRVKSILKFMSYTAYNSLLELCFCMDEFALPKPSADELVHSFDSMESSDHLADDFGNKTLTPEDQNRLEAEAKGVSNDKTSAPCNSFSVISKDVPMMPDESDHLPQDTKDSGGSPNGLLTVAPHSKTDVIQERRTASCGDIDSADASLKERRSQNCDETCKSASQSLVVVVKGEQSWREAGESQTLDNVFETKAKASNTAQTLMVDSSKKRHFSGMSSSSTGHGSDTTSDRSTPDIFRSHNNSREDTVFEINQVVGNIFCVIPASADDDNEASKRDAAVETQGDATVNADGVNPAESGISAGEKEGRPASQDEVVLESGKSSRVPSSSSINGDTSSTTTTVAKKDTGNRTLTSQLTELTDFSDPLLGYQNTKDESIFDSHPSSKIALKEIKQTNYKRFRKALDGVHLSVSPYHKYNVPFIETDKGLSCNSRHYLPEEIFWSPLFDGESKHKAPKVKAADLDAMNKQSNKETIEILNYHPLVTCNLTEPIWERSTQSILADFRARGGRIRVTGKPNALKNNRELESNPSRKEEGQGTDGTPSHVLWEKKLDCLDPANHQRLMVLFSSFSFKSNNHPYPCVYPWVVTMEFYGRNDITLGGFLERFCFRKQYSCPSPSCDVPMTDHIRRFVHGNACINVLLRKLDSEWPGGRDNILMWSWCRKCKMVTPVVPISADTWSLSFAKYLDLRFRSSSLLRRGSAEPCPHSLHHEHFQYFCHRDVVASFKYASITVRELALPALLVHVKPPLFDSTLLSKSVTKITLRATERYNLIFENTMKLKNEMTSETQTKTLSDFLAEQQMDRGRFRDSATNIQMKIQALIRRVRAAIKSGSSEVDFALQLNAIEDHIKLLQRQICEDVMKWNAKILEFVTSQQKKMRSQARKEKDTGSVDELEKSLKIPTASSKSLAHANTSGPPSANSVTEASESPSLGSGEKFVLGDSSPLPCHTEGTGANGLQGDEVNGAVDTSHGSMAPSHPDGANNGTTSGSVPSTPGLPQPQPLALAPPTSTSTLGSVLESNEDSNDGWLQDLKGVTRRWLSPISFTPMSFPFELSEHYILPLCERMMVVVFDQEPSSIIAYALSSSDYLQRLKEIQTAAQSGSPDPSTLSTQSSANSSKGDFGNSTSGHSEESGRRTGVLSFLRGISRDTVSHHSSPTTVIDTVHYTPKSELEDSTNTTENNGNKMLDDSTPSPDEKPKAAGNSSTTSPHIELQFSDASAKFYCRIYFADQFRKLRKLTLPGGENVFVRSLCRCKPWEAKGGKSGSSFCKTDDDRFILKQMSTMEIESFEKFGPQYFAYIKSSYSEHRPTALAKILGVYRIGFRNSQTNNALRQDVLVMENLFYNRKITQKFDLKGSMRNRLVSTAGRRGEEELVLLDENLLKSSVENPLYLRTHSKAVLKAAITSDSAFLSANLVMDYSLLVGIDDASGEMVVGIIDYIRTFTWDKRLEMVVKAAGILGGQGKMPTVVSPQLYRSRFLEAMEHYFLQVPTCWTGLGMDSNVRHL